MDFSCIDASRFRGLPAAESRGKPSQTGGVVFKRNHRHFTLCFMDEPRVAGIVLDVQLYRGAFGSPNSMGQVAAIGALLLIHGGLTGKIQWLRYLEASIAVLALG